MKKEVQPVLTDGKVDSSGAVADNQEAPEDEALITLQNSALILVDIQYDFLSPHGALSVPSAPEILPTAYGLLDEGLEWKAVVASKDFHPPSHISFASTHHAQPFTKLSIPNSSSSVENEQVESKTIDLWPDHCVQGTQGCQLDPGIQDRLDRLRSQGREVKVIEKGTDPEVENYSAFMTEADDDLLNGYLRSLGVRHLFCVGLAGDYCVSATCHSALRLGYRVYWIRSGIRSVSGSSGQLSIERSLSSSSSSSSSSSPNNPSSSFELIENPMETIKKLSL